MFNASLLIDPGFVSKTVLLDGSFPYDLLGSRSRPSAVPSVGDDSYYQPYDVFTCPKCDRVYKSERDLAVHRSYCYGGV